MLITPDRVTRDRVKRVNNVRFGADRAIWGVFAILLRNPYQGCFRGPNEGTLGRTVISAYL